MRKIIAFTTICFLSLLLKNENGNCKSKCDVSCCKKMQRHSTRDADANTSEIANEIKQFDGFFFKI